MSETEVQEVEAAETETEQLNQDMTDWLASKGKLEVDETETVDESVVDADEPEAQAADPEIAADDAVEPGTEEEQPRVSRAFSKVAAKERKLQSERQQLTQLKDELKVFQQAKEAADSGDMLGAMNKLGWNYSDATKQVLQDGRPQNKIVKKNNVTPEIEQRLAKLEQMEKQKEIDSYVGKLKNIVDTDDRFELVRAQWDNAWPTILEMQKIVATESGTVKPEHEILQDVEDFYEQQTKQLVSASKIKKLLGQTDAGKTKDTPSDSQRTRTRTLRNKVSASQPAPKAGPRTKRERLEEALAIFDSSARG
ncbi:MAG: hypothetical protein ACPGQQ_01250 [Candidatus Puniceispirillaceae bacterium]